MRAEPGRGRGAARHLAAGDLAAARRARSRRSCGRRRSRCAPSAGCGRCPPSRTTRSRPGIPAGSSARRCTTSRAWSRTGAGLRVAAVETGGWDLHAGAGRADGGPMRDRLQELGQALAAFANELGGDFGRVTVVTVSEFGRRAAENGRVRHRPRARHARPWCSAARSAAAGSRPVAGPRPRPARGRRPRGHHGLPVGARRGPRHPARRDRPARRVPRLHAEGRRRGASATLTCKNAVIMSAFTNCMITTARSARGTGGRARSSVLAWCGSRW